MKKMEIIIKFDTAKEGREASREIFKGVFIGSFAHKNKKKYCRREKHRKSHE